MSKELEKQQVLPKLADLYNDVDMVAKQDQLNFLLGQNPKAEWIKVHPYIQGWKDIPIDKVEWLLRRIFKSYKIEITGQGTAFNGVWVTVRVHYLNPTTGEWSYYDGIGAQQLQTKKGTSPAEMQNINSGAVSMAFPIAKTIAIKDACDHFGRLFGSDLNRRDIVPIMMDEAVHERKAILERAYNEVNGVSNAK